MATYEELSSALVKADAAGNVEDARALANAIRNLKPPGAKALTPQNQSLVGTDAIPNQRQYGLTELPGEAISNFPKSAGKFATGIYEAISSPVQTIKGLIDIGAGALQNALPQGVVDFVNSFSSDPANADRAVAAANAVGGMYKDRYGDYEKIKRTFAEDPVGFAADLSTLLSGGAGVARLGGASKTSQVLSTGANLTNPLKPAELVVRAGMIPIKEVGKIVNTAFNAKNALLNRVAEGQAPAIINALRTAEEIVPGSAPTAAEAAAKTGVVGYQQLGKSAAQELQTEFKARTAQKGAAQTKAIQQVGQTPEALEAAKTLRGETANINYGVSDKVLAATDDAYAALLKTPAMKKALDKARELAANKREPFQIGEFSPEKIAPSVILNAQGKPISQTVIPATQAQIPGTSVQLIKQAFDDLINDPAAAGFKGNEARSIMNVKKDFLNWAESKNQPYAEARSTFAKQSEPINQMQVGQYLQERFTPTLGVGTAADRAQAYGAALKDAPSTIKRATGDARFKELTQILTPDQIKILDDVKADLARSATSRNLASGPLKPEFDVSKATFSVGGEGFLPNTLNTITTVTNTVLRKLKGRIDQKLATEIATEMLFPGKAADALEKAFRQQRTRELLAETFKAPGIAAMKIPGGINMLNTQENRNSLRP
jgi:hypothetical protein